MLEKNFILIFDFRMKTVLQLKEFYAVYVFTIEKVFFFFFILIEAAVVFFVIHCVRVSTIDSSISFHRHWFMWVFYLFEIVEHELTIKTNSLNWIFVFFMKTDMSHPIERRFTAFKETHKKIQSLHSMRLECFMRRAYRLCGK